MQPKSTATGKVQGLDPKTAHTHGNNFMIEEPRVWLANAMDHSGNNIEVVAKRDYDALRAKIEWLKHDKNRTGGEADGLPDEKVSVTVSDEDLSTLTEHYRLNPRAVFRDLLFSCLTELKERRARDWAEDLRKRYIADMEDTISQIAKLVGVSSAEEAIAAVKRLANQGSPEPQGSKATHGCHCDLENMPEGFVPDECVMDAGGALDDNCVYARQLRLAGKSKESCSYWRPIVFRQKQAK